MQFFATLTSIFLCTLQANDAKSFMHRYAKSEERVLLCFALDYNRCDQVLLCCNLSMHAMLNASHYLQNIVSLMCMALIITGTIKYCFVAIPACMQF